jgi:hypothetical protein
MPSDCHWELLVNLQTNSILQLKGRLLIENSRREPSIPYTSHKVDLRIGYQVSNICWIQRMCTDSGYYKCIKAMVLTLVLRHFLDLAGISARASTVELTMN